LVHRARIGGGRRRGEKNNGVERRDGLRRIAVTTDREKKERILNMRRDPGGEDRKIKRETVVDSWGRGAPTTREMQKIFSQAGRGGGQGQFHREKIHARIKTGSEISMKGRGRAPNGK